MVNVEYGFLCVYYEATGIGHNEHGSYPTGVWHMELCQASKTHELVIARGDIDDAPASHISEALTTVAADGWRAEETSALDHAVGPWKSTRLLIRVARATARES